MAWATRQHGGYNVSTHTTSHLLNDFSQCILAPVFASKMDKMIFCDFLSYVPVCQAFRLDLDVYVGPSSPSSLRSRWPPRITSFFPYVAQSRACQWRSRSNPFHESFSHVLLYFFFNFSIFKFLLIAYVFSSEDRHFSAIILPRTPHAQLAARMCTAGCTACVRESQTDCLKLLELLTELKSTPLLLQHRDFFDET